jgi:uncharacterized protein (DUF2336 family)
MNCPISFMADVEAAIAHGSGSRRAEMLRRVTELFVGHCPQYSDDEIALFDDVISLLAGEIETAARVTLAAQLAPIPNAPRKIINRLANDDAIEVAWPVLAHSERVDENALIESAMMQSQQHLLAICKRRAISERVTDVMIARGERQVLAGIAGNPGARISELGYATLVQRSEEDDDLIERVGSRTDIPRPLFLKLLTKASQEVRLKLNAAHPHAPLHVEAAVTQATDAIQAASREESSRYDVAEALVTSLHRAGQLRDVDVSRFADDRQFEETMVALSLLCGLSVETIEGSMTHERIETALVFVKAGGLSRATAKSVLHLCVDAARLAQTDIDKGLASFDRLKSATAQELVRFYQLREATVFTRKQ